MEDQNIAVHYVISYFFKVGSMAFDCVFSVRDGSRDHKINYVNVFPRNYIFILTNLFFVNFIAYDVNYNNRFQLQFHFLIDVIFVKCVQSSF